MVDNLNTALYDTRCPRFVLINNPPVKILPEDTIDVADYDDYFILEDEPEGFDQAEIILERDDRYHGLNYEYSLDVLRFGCDFGKGYLEGIFSTYGTDAHVIFVYGYGSLNSLDVLYVGSLDFNEFTIENNEYVVLNLRKDDFNNILQSNFDIPQSVEPDRTVLLYSKAIPKKVEYRIPRQDFVIFSDFFNSQTPAFFDNTYEKATPPDASVKRIIKTDPSGYVFINDGKEGDTDLEVFPTYDFQVDAVEPIDPSRLKYLFRAKSDGVYNINITHWMGVFISNDVTDYSFIKLKTVRTEFNGLTVIEANTYDFVDSFVPTGIIAPSVILQFEEEFNVQMFTDECFYLYIEIDTTSAAFSSDLFINNIVDVPFNYDINSPVVVIKANSFAPSSEAKMLEPYDLINGIFTEATQLGYNVVQTDFFTEGCGKFLYLTNGAHIRGGEKVINDNDKLLIKDSPSGILSKLANLFNLGWGIEYDYNGNEVVRIEPTEYFYQDAKLLDLDDSLIADYVRNVDPSKVYNEIEVGFSKYSKQRETDKGGTIDDIHTKHTYQTPITKNKSKLSIITDLVLSAYEIEILRRKQFEKSGSTVLSNFNEDNNVFGIQMSTESVEVGGTAIFYNEFIGAEDPSFGASQTTSVAFQVGDTVTYTSRAGVEQTRTITAFSSGIVNFGSEEFPLFAPLTLINFAEELVGADTGAGDVTIVRLSGGGGSILAPESIQPFTNVLNLISPTTTYNLRYTPKRMFLNWAKLFNGGFRTKGDFERVEFKQGDGNTELITRFNTDEECLLGDINRLNLLEKSNLTLGEIFDRDYLFLPYKVSFSYPLSFEELNYIRKGMRNLSIDGNNYGYLEYVNPSGATEQIYITSIKFNPAYEEAKIEGWLKNDDSFIIGT